MGTAKDGYSSDAGPTSITAKPAYALDDADNVHILKFVIPQWSGTLLGSFKHLLNRGAILCDRVGWTEIFI